MENLSTNCSSIWNIRRESVGLNIQTSSTKIFLLVPPSSFRMCSCPKLFMAQGPPLYTFLPLPVIPWSMEDTSGEDSGDLRSSILALYIFIGSLSSGPWGISMSPMLQQGLIWHWLHLPIRALKRNGLLNFSYSLGLGLLGCRKY